MRDIERELRDLGDRTRDGQSRRVALNARALTRIKLRRLGTVMTGLIVVAALALGGTFAAGAFTSGTSRIGPAQASPSPEFSASLYAMFDDERVELAFQPEGGMICYFGALMTADDRVQRSEIVEGEEERTSAIVLEPNPNEISVDGRDSSMGWCVEGVDGEVMNAILESPDRYFLVLTYRNGDEAISALRRDNGDGNYATGRHITIAEGTFLGVDWEYYGYDSNDGLCLEFAWGRNSGGGCGFGRPPADYVLSIGGTSLLSEPGVATVAEFEGQVADVVERLTVEVDEGEPQVVELVTPPRGLGLDDRQFVHLIDARKLDRDSRVWLVAYDRDDKVLARERVTGLDNFAPQDPSEEGPPGEFAAIWPEDTAREASDACETEIHKLGSWRTDPEDLALQFAARVLGWEEATIGPAEPANGVETLGLRRAQDPDDRAAVIVYAREVMPGCWSISGVNRPPDNKPTGVGIGVEGRDVQIGFDPLGAATAVVEVGYGGRDVTETWDGSGDSGVEFRLPFDPDTTGHFLILMKDENGQVFSANGSSLPAGDFAAG